jgi:hypothetical protein
MIQPIQPNLKLPGANTKKWMISLANLWGNMRKQQKNGKDQQQFNIPFNM